MNKISHVFWSHSTASLCDKRSSHVVLDGNSKPVFRDDVAPGRGEPLTEVSGGVPFTSVFDEELLPLWAGLFRVYVLNPVGRSIGYEKEIVELHDTENLILSMSKRAGEKTTAKMSKLLWGRHLL